ncbi:alpha/beta fold hydrolase [Nocardioides terrigena]|uniref:alpha/beta fold hydrolase n=1 Tax=Nocardioides terrigena TaxID=424797 RepID=UPI000D2F9733|nr:alpha/beta fold hydrolase [Nocardioides terrigena]
MSARILAAGVTLALGAALLGAPGATAAPTTARTAPARSQAAAPSIDWGRCRDGFLRASGARCAMLTVPLDHADPTGPTIELAVSRVRHRGPKDRGVMFTNPGGPGGSGTYLAGYGQFVPRGVGRTYDWIGMDPRGVGESRPALTCDRRIGKIGTRPPYEPSTDAIVDAWVSRSEAYAADCGTAAAAALLPHLRTTDTVADFEVLREALGVDEVSFYGFSYGTYIAQVYATLHPERIDRLVLDGVVDPRDIWYAANAAQNVAFEKSMGGFWRWAARGHADVRLGRTAARVERTYYRLLRRLARRPVSGVGAADLADVVLGAGYARFLWPDVASALSEITTRGTARQARRAYVSANPATAGSDNGYATYLATICTDAPWPTDLATLLADNERQDRRHPFLTWPNGWFNAPCRTWPAPPAAAAVEIATSDREALLVNETFDGATPIAGARELRRRFTGAVLIEGVGGSTHAGSLSGVACVDDRIARYLATGRLPARRSGARADVRCRPVPAPPVGLPDRDGGFTPLARPVVPVG